MAAAVRIRQRTGPNGISQAMAPNAKELTILAGLDFTVLRPHFFKPL